MTALNILVVDDEPAVRDFFSKLIAFLGHHSILAEDGYQAVERVKKDSSLDLVFLDFKMPGLDGFETYKKIRDINKEVPVVMVTGYAPENSLSLAKEAGMNGFVRKPMELSEIKKIVEGRQKTPKKKELSVLVIDDDPSMLDLFKNMASTCSYSFKGAINAAQTKELLKKEQFDLIFLDVVLPADDAELIQTEIAKLPAPQPQIILISGFQQQLKEELEKATLAVSGCLYKPFDLQEVLGKIQEVAKKKGV